MNAGRSVGNVNALHHSGKPILTTLTMTITMTKPNRIGLGLGVGLTATGIAGFLMLLKTVLPWAATSLGFHVAIPLSALGITLVLATGVFAILFATVEFKNMKMTGGGATGKFQQQQH